MPAAATDVIRARLRQLRAAGGGTWLVECDDAIRAAQRRGDGDAVASLCLLAAAGLDADGRLTEALERLDVGLAWARAGSEARAHLWLARAGILVIAGRVEEAREALALAERTSRSTAPASARAQLERATYRAHLGAVALDPLSLHQVQATVAEAQRADLDWLASGLVVWVVPWLAAHGLLAGAMPWVGWLDAAASRAAHAHRAQDAAAFAYVGALTAVGVADAPAEGANSYAAWRVHLAALRGEVLRGREDEVADRLAELEARTAAMGPGFRDGNGAFRAFVQAYAGLDVVGLHPPEAVTLVTLPAWIAGAEAAALAGTRAEAERWHRALTSRVPSRVVTSLEWPASIARVRSLLAVRAGDLEEAGRLLREAIDESTRRRAPIEAALAVVQLHALVSEGQGETEARALEQSRALLERLGVAIEPIERASRRAVPGGRAGAARGTLSPREFEVLVALEDGLTYREVGERLGIGWRTAQTHAYRIYRKLGVSGRRGAVQEARRRRVL